MKKGDLLYPLPAAEYVATPARPAYWSGFANSLLLAGVFTMIGFVFWPMYLLSMIAVLLAPFVGIGLKTGLCPSCKQPLWGYAPETECLQCGQKILVRKDKFFASSVSVSIRKRRVVPATVNMN